MKYIRTLKKHLESSYQMDIDVFNVPVDFIWQYREFDRCGDDNLYGDDYIKQLTDDIKKHGIKNPITLQIDTGKALVTEGNHRLCIAIKLGLETIPVRVVYRQFGSINKHKAKPIKYNSTKWSVGIWD